MYLLLKLSVGSKCNDKLYDGVFSYFHNYYELLKGVEENFGYEIYRKVFDWIREELKEGDHIEITKGVIIIYQGIIF